MPKLLLVLLLFGLAASVQAGERIYIHRHNATGTLHIGNQPLDRGTYTLVQVRDRPVYQSSIRRAQPPSQDAVVASASGGWQLRDGVRLIKWGRNNATPQASRPSGGLPFRVNQERRQRFTPYIERAARQHNLEPALLHAVISAESAYNPNAVSSAGAQGLMQLMPATAQRFGVNNSFDPAANINGGATYLRWLLTHFDNNLNLALAGYNAGEGAVKRHGNTIPPYAETQTYVQRVLRFYHHYRAGG